MYDFKNKKPWMGTDDGLDTVVHISAETIYIYRLDRANKNNKAV